VAVDIYGGDIRVIAAREELFRVAASLDLACYHLREAPLSAPDIFLDLLPNPLPNIQLAFQLPPVINALERMSTSCLVAAESYFSTEAQVMAFLQQLFQPLSDSAGLLAAANPVSAAMSDIVSQTGTALAVIGLITAPSLGSSQLIAQGARVVSHASGFQTPAAMLAGKVPLIPGGRAELLSSAPVAVSGGLAGMVGALRAGYWSPASSIRVQTFAESDGRALVVFIPGTQSFNPLANNPLNITSNFGVYAGTGSPSQGAVEDALRLAGAGSGDRVIFVGHSQGGLIAANLAAEPQEYAVSGLVTLGSPVAHLNLGVPTVSIQHQQDPIPLLSGIRNPMTESWVTISSGQEFEDLVQAHHISSYAETVSEAVGQSNAGLQSVLERMKLPQGVATESVYRLLGN